jgi:hypothetical protein
MLAKADCRRYALDMSICYVDSPVGRLALEADHDAVTGVRWAGPAESLPGSKSADFDGPPPPRHAARAARQTEKKFGAEGTPIRTATCWFPPTGR